RQNHDGFRDLLRKHQDGEGNKPDEHRWQIDERTPGKNVCGSSNSANGCRRHPLDERFHLPVLSEAAVVRGCNDDNEVWWCKYSPGGHERANWSSNQVADESCGNYYRPRCGHGHRYRVHKLLLREPMEFLDDSTVEKRHDGQTTAKNESPRLQEKQEER